MDLYMAVCTETKVPKIFDDYDELKEFAIKERYAYTYYKLGEVEELPDHPLFYND